MTPNVQPFRKARGRWFVFLMSTALWGLVMLSALEPEPALALNGSTVSLSCPSCYSSGDFITSALTQAYSLSQPGLYVVVSQTYARTGFIQVTGEVPACGKACGEGLLNASGAALGQDGGPLGSDAELNNIDVGVFGLDRTFPMYVTAVPGCGAEQSDCGDSLASSTDTGVGIMIGIALAAQGIDVNNLPQVLSIAVTFQNGDVAVYQHVSGGGPYGWIWGQKAWNSNHQPIDRNGNVIVNPNSSGSGSGSGSGATQGPLGSLVYGFSMYSDCVFNTSETITVNGGVIIVSDKSYAPC